MTDSTEQQDNWYQQISVVDASLNAQAIANIVKIDSEMLVNMNELQVLTQRDLTQFGPVIVAQFTPGGGKFTLVHCEYGKPSRITVEPVANLFAIAKSIAHTPLGIYGCFGAYSTNPLNQGWRSPLTDYRNVIENGLMSLPDIEVKDGYQIDESLAALLVSRLNQVTGQFDGAAPVLNHDNVLSHIQQVFHTLLSASIDFIDTQALTLERNQSPARVFQQWCAQTSDDDNAPDDTVYKLITQCQVIAATAQAYGITSMMKTWRKALTAEQWQKLYAVVEGEWVTRESNSIAQCMLPEMAEKQAALNQHLMIVTNLEGVSAALKFLARILEDRAAAAMILTEHTQDREHLSGQTDLLGPVMQRVLCPYQIPNNNDGPVLTN
ncbi:hypothetical protein FM037_13585 [Shewanella psychropiezotolerans]|uniref:Uncharacterized protein n=1 Tax=Shewanella psychropiezotolerans TaxID=2593655 RepID=A0ABX5WZ37_9GAMM|nr:hypothetical protein [Shewanella psychropiezotolerans]QDO84076.1 hypothetical protein FM037_13585 [Shewanella psychropiezotolerans]